MILFDWLLEKNYPDTAIGHEGLRQVTEYLEKWLAFMLIKPLLWAGAVLLAGWFDNWFENRHEKIRPKFRPVFSKYLAVIAAVTALFITTGVSRFDLQAEKNGYKGLKIMKAVSLLADCQHDLEEQQTASAKITLGKISMNTYRVTSGGRGGRSVYTAEYAICDTDGVTVSQISKNDRNRMKDSFCGYLTHDVEQFVHSGFIASIDGLESDIPDDHEQMFTIEYRSEKKFRKIVRNTQPFEGELKNLTLVCIYDGKRISEILAAETELPNTTYEGAEYFLEAFIDGKLTRVSNILII
ncbi:hypothetical protein [Ruminococcus sp. YE78]|nr:hypothetical protein [Ruminococcus sp. YE78]